MIKKIKLEIKLKFQNRDDSFVCVVIIANLYKKQIRKGHKLN